MARFAVVLITALAMCCVAAQGASAASPVANVQCSVADDGAGFTSVQLVADGEVRHPGAHPATAPCGAGSSASPPPTALSGGCPPPADNPPPCNGSASASASASTAATLSSSGATLSATATGRAQALIGGHGPDLRADSEQSIGGLVRFTITAPSTYHVSGTASTSGVNNSGSADVTLVGPGVQFIVTSGANSATGQLAPGTYTLHAFADADTHATFNSSDPASASGGSAADASATLTISAGGGCPATALPDVQVGLALAEGCFVERQDAQGHGTGVFETDQEAWVGGFDLSPRAGGKLVLEPGNIGAPVRAEGSGVDWVLSSFLSVPAPLSELKPFTPSYTLGINVAGTLERFVALPLLKGASAQIKVTWGPGGASAKLEAQASLEDISKNIGTAFSNATGRTLGTLAAKLTLALSNNAPIDLTQGELQVPEFAVELKDSNPKLKLGFGGAKFKAVSAGGHVTWSGEVTMLFPWESENGANQGAVTGRLFFTDLELGGVGLAVSGFEIPLGQTGWDLSGVEGNLILRPHLAFDVGATLKQHIAFGGVPVLKSSLNIKGFQLAATDCSHGQNPFAFVGTINSPTLEDLKLGVFKGQVTMCAYVPSATNFAFEAGISGDLTVDVGRFKKLVSARGSATGWFQGSGNRFLSTDFNLDGSYQVQLPVIGTIGANGVISSEGYAFCGTYGFISEGFGTTNWVDAPEELVGCDLTPFRVAPHAADIAAAGGARTVHVPSGQNVFAMAVRGPSGAPRVRIAGPGGVSFSTPGGPHPLKNGRAIIIPVDQLRTTYVYLHNPSAGTWRIVPEAGSPPVTRIDAARGLPRAHVKAKLKHLRGGKLKLMWTAPAIPGQRIRLLDRLPGSATTIQRLTSKSRGSVTFRPGASLATSKHKIEADVFQNGRPRAQLTVLRYRVSPGSRPGAVKHPSAKRTGAGLSITWGNAPRAREYVVSVTSGSQTIAATVTRGTRLLLPAPPAGPLTIQITPRDALGRAGRIATLHVA